MNTNRWALAALVVAIIGGPARGQQPLKVGIIGCDTSHVIAFTTLLNAPTSSYGVRVVAAFPGGSPDLAASRDRLDGFVNQLGGMGVAIVDSIADLVAASDAILLESVDGRVHLAQFR